jgi:hypothetical protein
LALYIGTTTTALTNLPKQIKITLHNTMSMITKAGESALWLNPIGVVMFIAEGLGFVVQL